MIFLKRDLYFFLLCLDVSLYMMQEFDDLEKTKSRYSFMQCLRLIFLFTNVKNQQYQKKEGWYSVLLFNG